MGKKSREKRGRREEPWQPFAEATRASAGNPEAIAKQFGVPVADVLRELASDKKIYMNNIYTVFVNETKTLPDADWPEMVWLSIKRNDREPIRDWRHMQRIKNELVGPECEGVELYPAESRLIDTANQYHLWVIKNPEGRFPFGFVGRKVLDYDAEYERVANVKQRKL